MRLQLSFTVYLLSVALVKTQETARIVVEGHRGKGICLALKGRGGPTGGKEPRGVTHAWEVVPVFMAVAQPKVAA